MLNLLQQIFSYDFLVRAMIVGSLVSVCASLLGVTLVLKRYFHDRRRFGSRGIRRSFCGACHECSAFTDFYPQSSAASQYYFCESVKTAKSKGMRPLP